ncbi:MAG TPA: hypothetical protein VM580_10025 [Labilithrix sp.]|nr:hypothetical protein [Labilithrix sp.]
MSKRGRYRVAVCVLVSLTACRPGEVRKAAVHDEAFDAHKIEVKVRVDFWRDASVFADALTSRALGLD